MMSTPKLLACLCLTGMASLPVIAWAQDAPAPQPESQPATEADTPPAPRLEATIRQVKGIVQYRLAEDQPWQKVVQGQTLDIGVEFRTGPRSSVTFFLPPDQVITLDRLGTLKLLDAVNNSDATVATTELGMKYGRTRYQVEGGQEVEHHATIRSPNATLAIRGTQDVTLTDQRPGPASASSKGTRVSFKRTNNPVQVVFGSNSSPTQTLEEGDSSPGQTAMSQRTVDAGPRGSRTRGEFRLLNSFELYSGSQLSNRGVGSVRVQAQNAPTSQPGECSCGGHEAGDDGHGGGDAGM